MDIFVVMIQQQVQLVWFIISFCVLSVIIIGRATAQAERRRKKIIICSIKPKNQGNEKNKIGLYTQRPWLHIKGWYFYIVMLRLLEWQSS